MSKEKRECDNCKELIRPKHLKRMNSGKYCKKCYQEKKKEHREYLKREVLGLTKEQEHRELLDEKNKHEKEKRAKLRALKPKEVKVPKIQGSKRRSHNSKLSMYLTKLEKQVLWKKYILMGYAPELATNKIKRDVKFLSDLIDKLREKKKTDEEINRIFKEEFSKLVESGK